MIIAFGCGSALADGESGYRESGRDGYRTIAWRYDLDKSTMGIMNRRETSTARSVVCYLQSGRLAASGKLTLAST